MPAARCRQPLGRWRHCLVWKPSQLLSPETQRYWHERLLLWKDPEIHAGTRLSSLVSTMCVSSGSRVHGLGHLSRGTRVPGWINSAHHRPTLHPDTVTELEASGLPLFPFFFFFPFASVFPSVGWGFFPLNSDFGLPGGVTL